MSAEIEVLPIKSEVLVRECEVSLEVSGTQAPHAVLENLNIHCIKIVGDVDRHNEVQMRK